MKNKKWLKPGVAALVTALVAQSAVPVGMTVASAPVKAAEQTSLSTSGERDVTLGTGAFHDPSDAGGIWDGTYIYFGNQGNYPICFRVLDKNSTDYGSESVLLDANYALSRVAFDDNGSSQWMTSSLRKYLNGEFYEGNFSATERRAIMPSTKAGADGSGLSGDYLFVLDASEARNSDYGYGSSGALAKENMRLVSTDAEYALRSADGGNVQTVDDSGNFQSKDPTALVYCAPALNMNGGSIAFTTMAEDYKPAYLAPTDAANDNYLKLTLTGGSGFSASRKDSENNTVPAGYGFLVDVKDMGSADKGVNYSQISGMLVDGSGSVAAYGMLSEIAATGEVLVNVPATTPEGDYTFYVFAEDVRSGSFDHATDYASNFSSMRVHVGEANAVSEEAAQAIEVQNTEKTEQVKKNSSKSGSSTQAANNTQAASSQTTTKSASSEKTTQNSSAQKAVAHTVALQIEGSGSVKTSAQSATVGTVVILTAEPEKGWHFKNWTSSDVSVASDNKFTMPDKNVTVKAVFEKNASTHAINLGYMENSTVKLSATNAAKDAKIKATCKPKAGYHFVKWVQQGLTNDLKSENPITFTMPDNDVTLTAVCEKDTPKEYTIKVKTDGLGVASAAYSKAQANVWVNLSATPVDGWRFVRWDSNQVNPGGQNKFLMPAKNVTLTAVFEKIPESNYAVSTVVSGSGGQLWTTAENGSAKTSFIQGEKVIVQTKVDSGYLLKSINADGVDLTTDSRTGGRYFYMPAKSVSVTAVFEKEVEEEYEAYLVTSGDGSAWTQNAKGQNVRYFKEGERVYIQTSSNNAEVDSITSRDVTIQGASGAYDACFDMPKGGATVYVNFKSIEQSYEAYLVVRGGGTAKTFDTKDREANYFKAGERVFIKVSANDSKSEIKAESNDASIGMGGGAYNYYFDMPRGGATVYVTISDPEPEPEPTKTYEAYVSVNGNGTARTYDANDNQNSYFEAGDRVFLQIQAANPESKVAANSNDVSLGMAGGAYDYYFDMPKGGATISVTITEPEPVEKTYRVTTQTSGPGTAYTAAQGKLDVKNKEFKTGEWVYVMLTGDDVAFESADYWWLDGTSATDVRFLSDSNGFTYFVMPDHDVSLTVSTISVATGGLTPEPAAVSVVGDEGETDSYFGGSDYSDAQYPEELYSEPVNNEETYEEPVYEEPVNEGEIGDVIE